MAFKVHISNATGNQPGQVTSLLTAALSQGVQNLNRTDFKVTGTAGMAVDVAKGECFVYNSDYVPGTMDQRMFTVASSATETVNIASNSSGNPRIDIICVKVDTAASPGTQGVNAGSVVVVQGTPAATPSAPATPNKHLLLANVAVANGASVISNNEITDKRVQAVTGMVSPSEGQVINGKISRTVATNDLTIALKTLGGNDPSEAEPVWTTINGTMYRITSALSFTLNDGTNHFNLGAAYNATVEHDLFVYLGVNSGSVFIGASRVPYGEIYSDLSGTATSDFYFAASTTPSASDPITVIGRVNVILSATSAFNWSVPGTSRVLNRPVYETRLTSFVRDSTGWSSVSSSSLKYKVVGDLVVYYININGTSNSTTTQTNMPFVTAAFAEFSSYQGIGADLLGFGSIQPSSRVLGWGRWWTNNGNANSVIDQTASANSGTKNVYAVLTIALR